MTSRIVSVLAPLQAVGRGRLAAIALTSGAGVYVGVASYRWLRKQREKKGKLSSLTVFTSGVALGVVAMATGPALRRWRAPKPERLFLSVLPMLRANSEVREMVGASLTPALFRAYTYSGGIRWSGVGRSNGVNWRPIAFQPYGLQLLFQVHGETSSAMVSLDVRNHAHWGRGLVYNSLVVDLPNGERLVLKGNHSDSVVQRYTDRHSGH